LALPHKTLGSLISLNSPSGTVVADSVPAAGNDTIDYRALWKAVSVAESAGCTSHLAQETLNCTSIMQWDSQHNRSLKRYNSIEDNYKDFVAMWHRVYGDHLPTPRQAARYTGSDGVDWRNTVIVTYNNLTAS